MGRIWLIGMHEGEQNEGNHKVVKMVMRNKSIKQFFRFNQRMTDLEVEVEG